MFLKTSSREQTKKLNTFSEKHRLICPPFLKDPNPYERTAFPQMSKALDHERVQFTLVGLFPGFTISAHFSRADPGAKRRKQNLLQQQHVFSLSFSLYFFLCVSCSLFFFFFLINYHSLSLPLPLSFSLSLYLPFIFLFIVFFLFIVMFLFLSLSRLFISFSFSSSSAPLGSQVSDTQPANLDQTWRDQPKLIRAGHCGTNG